MFMNAHANFTRFHLKAISCVCPSISSHPCWNKGLLLVMGEYFMCNPTFLEKFPGPFYHNVYASMVSVWMIRNLMTLGCLHRHAKASANR